MGGENITAVPRLRPIPGTEILSAALDYSRRGWAVIPLAPRSKTPMSELLPIDRKTGKPSWALYRHRPASETEIIAWFEREPNINIAILCGEASGVVVVDVDSTPSQPLHLPPTVCASTGRGAHYYYRASELVATKTYAWGEVRGDGAYVVAPPSIHPSGARYEWADLCSPDRHELTELPAGFLGQAPERAEEPNIYIRFPEGPGDKGEEAAQTESHLLRWAKSEECAVAIMGLCGVSQARIGKNFRCVLPGHEERSPSASLWRHPKSNHIYYRDWHCRDGHEWYTIPEVYAAVTTGNVRKLTQAEQGVWLTRALAKAELIKLPSVMAPRLPSDTPQIIRDVFEGFRELLAIHSMYDAQRSAAPYTWNFASDWTGRGRRQCGDAIKWLLSRGYLVRVVAKGEGHRGKRLRSGLLAIGTPRSE